MYPGENRQLVIMVNDYDMVVFSGLVKTSWARKLPKTEVLKSLT